MPGYKGHLCGGITVYLVVIYCMYSFFNPTPSLFVELAACTAVGSLFPDIDIKSKGQKYFYWFFLAASLTCLLYEKVVLVAFGGMAAMVPMVVRHRGLFHQVWFVCLLPLCFWVFLSLYDLRTANLVQYHCLFFAVGAVSHIWLDMGLKRLMHSVLNRKNVPVKKRK